MSSFFGSISAHSGSATGPAMAGASARTKPRIVPTVSATSSPMFLSSISFRTSLRLISVIGLSAMPRPRGGFQTKITSAPLGYRGVTDQEYHTESFRVSWLRLLRLGGDKIADSLRQSLAGDLLPGAFEDRYAELASDPAVPESMICARAAEDRRLRGCADW